MDAQSIDQLMMLNGNKLPMEALQEVRNMLEGMDAQTARIRFTVMKDPLIALILSIFAGTLGAETGGVPLGAGAGAAGHGGDVLAGAAAAAPAPGTAPVASSSCIPLAGADCSGAVAGAS